MPSEVFLNFWQPCKRYVYNSFTKYQFLWIHEYNTFFHTQTVFIRFKRKKQNTQLSFTSFKMLDFNLFVAGKGQRRVILIYIKYFSKHCFWSGWLSHHPSLDFHYKVFGLMVLVLKDSYEPPLSPETKHILGARP